MLHVRDGKLGHGLPALKERGLDHFRIDVRERGGIFVDLIVVDQILAVKDAGYTRGDVVDLSALHQVVGLLRFGREGDFRELLVSLCAATGQHDKG